jgi:hypothetical protein
MSKPTATICTMTTTARTALQMYTRMAARSAPTDSEGRTDRVDFPNSSAYRISYSGDTVEVTAPNSRYAVAVLPALFRTVEPKCNPLAAGCS